MTTQRAIFISYRGADHAHAFLLRDRLARLFGEANIFFDKDRDSIPPASDFPGVLDLAIQSAEIVVAVIGPGWMAAESLARLNNDPKDFVRRELRGALQRRDKGESVQVLPLIFDGARMPEAGQLPADLSSFVVCQVEQIAIKTQQYDAGIDTLADTINKHCPGLRARRQNDWLRDLLSSGDLSRSRLGQDIAVRQPGRQFTKRRAASAELDAWWANWRNEHRAFILLGEEGDGKSWAVADWLADKVADVHFPVPVVVAPAHKLSQAGLANILAACLEKSLPSANYAWSKTLEELANAPPSTAPQFLLVVDAFNERPSLAWKELFNTLRASPWRDRVALIGLCRKEYWKELAIPNDGLSLPWTLSPFSPDELNEALDQRGAPRDQFTPEVLHWMSRPRYFDLALRLKDEIGHGGLTLERLIYEDWRDMTLRKPQRPCSHEDFFALISGLAEKHARRRIPLADFAAQAQAVTDSVPDLMKELTSAGIIDRQSGKLLFGSRHLPLALGLVLANALEESEDQSPAVLREIIARYKSSYAESDLQVRICAMALFHALSSKDFPEVGRLALLRAWIEGRNLDETDLHAIASYLPLQPATYLRMAEYIWGEAENREAQDAFMFGFLRHRNLPKVDAALRPAFARWLGFVYPGGYRAYFERDEAKLAEARREVEMRLGGPVTPGQVALLGVPLEITENAVWLRLAQVALAVMSHDRSQGYADQLLAGLVAATVMEGSHCEFGWLLHTCDANTASALLNAAKGFLERGKEGQSTAYLVARKILVYLGNEAARQLLTEIPEGFRFVPPLTRMHAENPCDSFGWLWTEDNYLDCLECSEGNGDFAARQLQEVALNPGVFLPPDHLDRLGTAGAGLDLSKIAQYMGNSSEQHQLKIMEPALCAFASSRYANLMRALAGTLAGRGGQSRRLLANELQEHLPVMGAAEREVIESAWRATLTGESDEDRWAELWLFPAVVFDRSASEQVRLMIDRGNAAGYFTQHAPRFRALSTEDLSLVLAEIQATDCSNGLRLYNLLWYLSLALQQPNEALRDLLLSRFDTFDTAARAYTMAIFVQTADQAAATQLIASGWVRREGREYALENHWGNFLLAELGADLSFADLLGRIAPKMIAYAVKQRGNRPEELASYARALDEVWNRIATLPASPEVDSISPYVRLRVADDGDPSEDDLGATDNRPETVRLGNYSWGGNTGGNDERDVFRHFDSDAQIARLNSLSQQVADVEERERELGNPWFGSSFSDGALDRLLGEPNIPWQKWIEPVLRNDVRARQLLARCRGFYEKLCAALLAHAPAEGHRLFDVLNAQQTVRITDAHTGLRVLHLDVFAAPPSPEVEEILRALLAAATSDSDLFEFVFMCERGGRGDWLREIAEQGLVSEDSYIRARALTLLGFSMRSADGERLSEWMASHGDSWHRDLADAVRKRYQRHGWSIVWFERFIDKNDRSEAWAAFRVFLRCVDRRFWLWLRDKPSMIVEPWKQDALVMNYGTIEDACKTNEKDWRDELLGQKLKPNELWPWMADYQ